MHIAETQTPNRYAGSCIERGINVLERFHHRSKHQQGFTLAELLVSLAVGALVFSVGVPSYTQFSLNSQQVKSANELLGSLHAARDLAVTRNVRVTVCPSESKLDCDASDWTSGWIVFIDDDANRSVGPTEDIVLASDEHDAIDLASSEFSNFLIFRPNGRVMVNNPRQNMGEFTLCDRRGSAHARVVVMDMSGRPRVSHSTADGSAPTCPSADS